jgi:hypothetical protein
VNAVRPPATLPDAATVAEIDRRAYDVTQNWFRRQGTAGLELRGIPFGEVVRRELWDLVGGALRRLHYPPDFTRDPDTREVPRETRDETARGARALGRDLYRSLRHGYRLRRARGRHGLLVRESARLRSVLEAVGRYPRIVVLPTSPLEPAHRRALRAVRAAGEVADAEARRIWRLVVDGMAAEGIELDDAGRELLRARIATELEQVAVIDHLIEEIAPSGVLLAGDNWPPFIDFVLAARKRGIPSVYLQHGRDCEHHYADEAYADAIAVWGPARLERYRRDSIHQPARLEVTGNPEYDDRRPPTAIATDPGPWLWITRPHAAYKCLSPSRSPGEGLAILDAFIGLLERRTESRLVIKPHPRDSIPLYRERIRIAGLADRIVLAGGSLDERIREAAIVFSEDSTGGMEAMLHGKPVIHVHFAPSQPTLPIAEYGAGLAARSSEALGDALARIESAGAGERTRMLEGQRAFLSDFAGPLDGRAAERAATLIERTVEGGT